MLSDPISIAAAAVSGLATTSWSREAKVANGYVRYNEAASTILLPHQLSLNSALDSTGSLTKKSTLMIKLYREFASGTVGNPDVFVAPRLIIDCSLEATNAQIRNEVARLYDFATSTIIASMRMGNL